MGAAPDAPPRCSLVATYGCALRSAQFPEAECALAAATPQEAITAPARPKGVHGQIVGAKPALACSPGQPRTAGHSKPQKPRKYIREVFGAATKEYDRARTTHRVEVREKALRVRLGKPGQISRKILEAKRANGKEILTTGEGVEREFLFTRGGDGAQGLPWPLQ